MRSTVPSLAGVSTGVGVLVALCCSALAPAAQEPPETLLRLDGSSIAISEIEQRIPDLMAKVWLPGMSVMVVQDGAIAYRQSFGVRDVRTGEAISAETSFAGLSFSKTITAYLVMRLVEKGVLDLDRPLYEYLPKPVPEYEFYADLEGDARYETITARHVLSHTTGWPNWRWLTDEGNLHFLFEPGARHSYSGEGFAYLQLALEQLTGRNLADLASKEVFAPLDMARSSMVWEAEYQENYAEDHDTFGRPMERDRRDEADAAGSLQTTIGDYTRFVIAVMLAQGLEPATRDLMLSRQVTIRHSRMFGPRMFEETRDHEGTDLSWTLGWGRIKTPFGWAFFHTGNDRGSANYAIAFPEVRAAVVLMGNSNRLEGIAQDVVEMLTADRSSPFDFLGYERWDGPRQIWLRTLAEEGTAAGRTYWESLGVLRRENGLDQEEAFRDGGEALAHFGTVENSVIFHNWRREIFPESSQAVRGLVRLLLDAGRTAEAVAQLEHAIRQPSPEASGLATELEWFAAWVGAITQPVDVAPERLEALAGEYGARRFELRDGRLFYGRDETKPEDYSELISMGDDTFVLIAYDFFRLRFELDDSGRATRVLGLYEDGHTDSNERSTVVPVHSGEIIGPGLLIKILREADLDRSDLDS